MRYQPDFFDAAKPAHRPHCPSRLKMVRSYIQGRVLDVGCSEGFFSFGVADLAKQVVGIERKADLFRECVASGSLPNVSFRRTHLAEFLDEDDQSWDVVLYLSVHHHLIKQYGMNTADRLLARLCRRADCLLFEMGQKNEKGCRGRQWWKQLPSTEDPDAWIQNKLENASGKAAVKIGQTPVHGIQRGLWKIA